ncbi:uncharacterized protein LOC144348251 [Saccoglossus kowalevskii]
MADQNQAVPGTPQQATQLPIPEKFDGSTGPKQAELWPKWLKRFELYRMASGLQNKTEREQVSTLLYAMGDCAYDILTTLQIDEETYTYEDVKKALNDYYQVRRNIIVERARFNKRVQTHGEPIDVFIQDLYRLAEDCDYGVLKDDLIRDKIVVGVLDDSLSDHLQMKSTLTLAIAVQTCRQAEARKQSREPKKSDKHGYSRTSTQTQDSCRWCGGQRHDHRICPARDSTCHKCQKSGHFKKVCRSTRQESSKINEVHNLKEIQIPFLGEVYGRDDYWSAEIKVNGHDTHFKLDTGATVSVISDKLPWLNEAKLSSTRQSFCGPAGTQLPVIGTFRATLVYRENKRSETVYVIKNQACSLLSRNMCVQLGLISRVDEVGKSDPPNTPTSEQNSQHYSKV